MNKQLYCVVFVLALLGGSRLLAQSAAGTGSATIDNSGVVVSAGTAKLVFSESLYLGPDSDWEINGTLEVWSRFIWIAPTARMHGSGKLIIHSPGDNPYYPGWQPAPTVIDANGGAPVDLDIEFRNPHNLVLQDITDPHFRSANPAGSRAAALHIGGQFAFAVDHGDIILNGHDLMLKKGAGLTGYNSSRMVVTGNSIAGHVIVEMSAGQPFVFPVGIAEGDYTPATLTPQTDASMHVSVQGFDAAAVVVPDPLRSISRLWHIYADQGVLASYTLQHNRITNGRSYVDADAMIVQYAGGDNWLSGRTQSDAEGRHTRSGLLTASGITDNSAWFSKFSASAALCGPEALDDRAAAEAGAQVTILVLENDRPCGSAIVAGSVRVIEQPGYGAVSVNPDGSNIYRAARDYAGTDVYRYEITDEQGLKDSAYVFVTVTERGVRIPNVFTPNGDGANDFFEIEGIGAFDRVDVTVVNRWGNEVYRSGHYRNDWNGEGLNEGTYYYSIVAYRGSEPRRYTGWVLIKK